MRLWVKILKDNKILIDTVYKDKTVMTQDTVKEELREICYKLDIPTPMLIGIQYRHLVKFNTLTLLEKDFIENIDFDKFVIENWI